MAYQGITDKQASRFWSKVKRGAPDECWEWQASRKPKGYGQLFINYHSAHAHRMAYQLTYGAIPDGMFVCHACDNPPCCNPAHLWLGTHRDNSADMVRKGRQKRPKTPPARRPYAEYRAAVRGEPIGRIANVSERDHRIYAAYQGGMQMTQIADLYGITYQRVSQIIRRVYRLNKTPA